jgi:hypothetical protein
LHRDRAIGYYLPEGITGVIAMANQNYNQAMQQAWIQMQNLVYQPLPLTIGGSLYNYSLATGTATEADEAQKRMESKFLAGIAEAEEHRRALQAMTIERDKALDERDQALAELAAMKEQLEAPVGLETVEDPSPLRGPFWR